MNQTPLQFLAFVVLSLTAASAQTTPSPAPAAPSAPPPACTAPEHRQFDFWLGSWTVRSPDGKITGTSEISRAARDCAILEQWKDARGLPGTSINYYDPETKHWHQLWVGGGGTILKLEGEFKNGAMVLEGESDDPRQAKPVKNRITWTPMPKGKVKQQWQNSEDGEAWTTVFVGIYSRE
jgi:hypothetical protein